MRTKVESVKCPQHRWHNTDGKKKYFTGHLQSKGKANKINVTSQAKWGWPWRLDIFGSRVPAICLRWPHGYESFYISRNNPRNCFTQLDTTFVGSSDIFFVKASCFIHLIIPKQGKFVRALFVVYVFPSQFYSIPQKRNFVNNVNNQNKRKL